MLEKPFEIIEGIRLLMRALNITKAAVGIEDNKMDAVKAMTDAARDHDGIEIITCEVKYPQGAEKNLIKAILDKEVPSGGLPMDVGVVVQNVGTAFAVYEALALNKPLIERVVTITGPGIEKPRNLLVRIGTLFSDVISQCGGFKKDVNVTKVISGGPMMGQAQFSLDVPVMKGTSGILVLTDEFKYEAGINPCIRCGKCVSACPMYLMPNELSQIGEFNRPDLAGQARVMDCVECGTCAYVCPSFRPIVQFIRYLKGEVAAAGQKAKAN
jgi:electron transport complex protein RnfC